MQCPLCKKNVGTWMDYYIEEGIKFVTIMCKGCNCVLRTVHYPVKDKATVKEEAKVG